MYDYQKIRRAALNNGLRDHGNEVGSSSTVYTHIEARDGSRFELTPPMTTEQLLEAASVHNCLFVRVAIDPNNPLRGFNIFSTTRVIGYFDNVEWVANRAFGHGDLTAPFLGPWIQTQNFRFKLIEATYKDELEG